MHAYSRFTNIPPSYFGVFLFKPFGDTNCFWSNIREIRNHNFEIRTGYYLTKQEEQDLSKKLNDIQKPEMERSNQSSGITSRLILPSNLNSCGCC